MHGKLQHVSKFDAYAASYRTQPTHGPTVNWRMVFDVNRFHFFMQAAFAVAKRLFAATPQPLTRDQLLVTDVSELMRCVQAVTPTEGTGAVD